MKNVKIDDDAYSILKETCKKYGLKMGWLASDSIKQICKEWEKANVIESKIRKKMPTL